MDYSDLSHNALIQRLAADWRNEALWREFMRRYHRYMAVCVLEECRRLHYENGLRQVDDILSSIYTRLVDQDCRALRCYQGRYEKSILKYLRIIAIRMVHVHYDYHHRKGRRPAGGFVRIDDDAWAEPTERRRNWLDLIPDPSNLGIHEEKELIQEINDCLEASLLSDRNAARDRLIFKLYHYKELEVPEIAAMPGLRLSEKRISNILSELRSKVQDCLRKKGIFL